jgi:WS/DGAT/MGAT family acyltransferase
VEDDPMSKYVYERLSALDTAFLMLEDHDAYMHGGWVGIYEAGPLRNEHGGIDFERIEQATEAVLPQIPRYRQKLKWIPYQNHPVWVDDQSFNLHYHLRHTSLARPGTERQLKRMAARILSQQLDRSKPLWETWVVEGLEGDRFAMIMKVHHCMIDGVAGVDLGNILLSTDPNETEIPETHPFVPRRTPSGRELLVDEVRRRLRLPLDAIGNLRRSSDEPSGEHEGRSPLAAARDTLKWGLRRPQETPFNAPIGPHRRFDWTVMDLGAVKAVRKALGGSVNDVVLTIVAGAVRRFFELRGLRPADVEFRTMSPVNVRTESQHEQLGNRVSAWVVELPIDERNPKDCIAKISAQTAEYKKSGLAAGGDLLMDVTEWLPGGLFELGARVIGQNLPFNMVVTNVPGPPVAWYLLGAKLLEAFGNVPIVGHLGLGVAVGSYAGKMCWGFNADWELLPDLHDFAVAMQESFEEVCNAAGVAAEPPGGPAE